MVCVAFGSASIPAHAVVIDSGARVIPESYFGLHAIRLAVPHWRGERRLSIWPTIKFGSLRAWASSTQWANLEPRKGEWNFANLDKYVALAEQHKVDLVVNLGRTPAWASARPDERCSGEFPLGCAAEPRDVRDWEDYVREVVSRYRGRVKYYEIWNEPKFNDLENAYTGKDGAATYFSGTLAKFVEMTRAAYRIVKQVDPAAKVLAAGMDGEEYGLKRLSRFFEAGGRDSVDIVSFHLYMNNSIQPEAIAPFVARLRAAMAAQGLEKMELWNSESGYFIADPLVPAPAQLNRAGTFSAVLSVDTAAAYVARALIIGAAAGLDRFFYFGWDVYNMALAANNGKEPSMAGMAYDRMARWLAGAALHRCESKDTLWICSLSRGSRRAWVVWHSTGGSDWSAPTEWQAKQMETLDGRQTVIPARLSLGGKPVLVKADTAPWDAGR
ncbi:MAG: endo-1,4-beta-xylanase [Burkholderiales bacterium]|nr:endo-1,4-beta-xylanase [Burkholderiales bacterium]